MLVIEKIEDFNQFLSLKEEWNKLLSESDSNTLFLTHEWLSVWWKNLGKGNKLFILCVKEDGKILAIAPFMCSKGTLMKLPVKKIEFIGAGWGYGGIILTTKKKECLQTILEYIKKFGQEGILVLSQFSNSQESMDVLVDTLKKSSFLYLVEKRLIPYIPLEGSWDEYFNSKSSMFRKRVRQKERQLRRRGQVSFGRYNGSMDVSEIMEKVFEISLKSWKAKQGTAIASEFLVKNFYLDLANVFYKKGWLDITILEVNSKPIAYQFGACYQQKYFDIDIAFDLSYSSVSPGNQLSFFVLRSLFGENISELDCLMPAKYRNKFATFKKQVNNIIIFKKRIYPLFLFFLRSKIFPFLKRKLK